MPVSSLQPTYPPPAGRAVEAPWGVAVAESVVQRFASQTERNTRWTTPPIGAVCATQADKFLWYFAGGTVPTGWKKIAQVVLDVDPVETAAMPKAGGTFTGTVTHEAPILLENASNTPYIRWQTTGATPTTLASIQALNADNEFKYNVTSASDHHMFAVGGVDKLLINGSGAAVTGILNVSGAVTASSTVVAGSRIYGKNGAYISGNGTMLALIDTTWTSDPATKNDVFIGFYGEGEWNDPGPRAGYVGYPGSTTLTINNDKSNGAIRLQTNGAGGIAAVTGTGGTVTLSSTNCDITATDIDITCGTGNLTFNTTAGSATIFQTSGTERGRATASFMWGKTVSGTATAGVELFESGPIYSLTTSNGGPNLYLRHAVNADGAAYIQFASSTGGIISELQQDNVSPVGLHATAFSFSAPSDYRLKNDLGPIVGALDRVMQLLPKHLQWKDTGKEFGGFIAHELATVIPDAVRGEKDAVYDAEEAERMGVEPGSIKAQEVDLMPLIPLLTAAVQELKTRVDALSG